MERDERCAAKLRLIAAMRCGQPWPQAPHDAGLQIGRATAYRLLERVRREGDGAVVDRRGGHACTVRPPIRQWLEDYCRVPPSIATRLRKDEIGASVRWRSSDSSICITAMAQSVQHAWLRRF